MSGDSRGYWGDKEHTGRLRISRGAWPAPEGAQFHEESVTQGEGGGAAVCRRGRLLWKNDLGGSEWVRAKLYYPDNLLKTLLGYHGAHLRGGPRILRFCQCPSLEFVAVEDVEGIRSGRFGEKQGSGKGVKLTGLGRMEMEEVAYQMTLKLIRTRESHGPQGNPGLDSGGDAKKAAGGTGNANLGDDEGCGEVSDSDVSADSSSSEDAGDVSDGDISAGSLVTPYTHGGVSDDLVESLSIGGGYYRGGASKRVAPNTLATIEDPLASIMYQLDVLLGMTERGSSRDSDDSCVNQTVLDRYRLADIVFHMFGGGVNQPRPGYMPEDMYEFLVGLSSPKMMERFHPEAELKRHIWMKRREAASAAGSGPGEDQSDNARFSYCAGDGVRTMWTPQIGSIVFKARALLETPQNNNNNNNPLAALARLVRKFGAAGPIRAARRATTPRITDEEKGAAAPAAGARGFRRRLGSASENVSDILAKDGLSGVREHNFYPDHLAHIYGPCKGKGKGRGRGRGAPTCEGEGGGGGAGSGGAGASGGGSSKRRKLRHNGAYDIFTGAPIEPARDYQWSGSEYLTPPEDTGAVAEALANAQEEREDEARERAMAAGVPHLSEQSGNNGSLAGAANDGSGPDSDGSDFWEMLSLGDDKVMAIINNELIAANAQRRRDADEKSDDMADFAIASGRGAGNGAAHAHGGGGGSIDHGAYSADVEDNDGDVSTDEEGGAQAGGGGGWNVDDDDDEL